jgi:transcription antitermination factor NusG
MPEEFGKSWSSGRLQVELDIALIDAIGSRIIRSEACVVERPKKLSSGQCVQVMDGPFVGLEAVFMREMSEHQRAMVLLRTLAIQARVVLEINQLIPYAAA